jgi:hypothetical protein
MLNIGGSFDMSEPATLLLMPAIAAYAVAVVVAIVLFLLSRRDSPETAPQPGDTQLLESARKQEYRDLLIIALAPLLVLIIVPGLLVIHLAVAVAAAIVFLLIASTVFRHMLRAISGTV